MSLMGGRACTARRQTAHRSSYGNDAWLTSVEETGSGSAFVQAWSDHVKTVNKGRMQQDGDDDKRLSSSVSCNICCVRSVTADWLSLYEPHTAGGSLIDRGRVADRITAVILMTDLSAKSRQNKRCDTTRPD